MTSDNVIELSSAQVKKVEMQMLRAKRLEQYNASAISGWTPTAVNNAQTAQSTGDWSQITKLGRKILTDPFISAAYLKRVNALVQSDFSVQSGGQSEDDLIIAKLIEKEWHVKFIPEKSLRKIVGDLILTGLYVGHITYKDVQGTKYPVLEHINTEFVKYNQTTCRWELQSQGGMKVIEPGLGNWLLITSWNPGEIIGAASHLGLAWLYMQMSQKTWIDGNRRSAAPTVIIQESTDSTSGAEASENVDQLIADMASQIVDGVGYLTNGKTANVLSMGSSWNPQSFKDINDSLKTSVSTYLNGGNLSNDVQGGSYAAAVVHNGNAAELTQGDASIISTELHNQYLTPFIQYNFGDLVETPWPKWSTEQEADEAVKLDNMLKLKELLGPAFVLEDPVSVASEFGIKIKAQDSNDVVGEDNAI